MAKEKYPDDGHRDPGESVLRLPVLNVGGGVDRPARVGPAAEGGGAPDAGQLGLNSAEGPG